MAENDWARTRSSISAIPDSSSSTGTSTETSGDPATSMAPSSRVAVVLVLWNCAQELGACLRALEEEGAAAPLDVICVDNGSEDDSVAIARQHGAHVVEMGRNAGFPAAVNAGLTHARTPYVLLLNPDVELRPGALTLCLEVLTADPSIGLVGCNLRRVRRRARLGHGTSVPLPLRRGAGDLRPHPAQQTARPPVLPGLGPDRLPGRRLRERRLHAPAHRFPARARGPGRVGLHVPRGPGAVPAGVGREGSGCGSWPRRWGPTSAGRARCGPHPSAGRRPTSTGPTPTWN